jgi:hypothetical protein
MRLFILLSLISFSSFAGVWFDMESGKEYSILQGLSLPQRERSGSKLEVIKGEKFRLKEIIGVGMGLGLFNFEYKNCPGPEMETEIEVYPVEGTSPLVEIGAMVAEGCEFWVYVELKDFWTKSLFE